MSIHRGPDGPGEASVASAGRRFVPYSTNAVAFAAALVVALAFGIYLRTMLPSTGFWDTGEAQTVPPTVSIFHPTGFPVYSILGWLWSQLPLGSVAWRMNLLSAVCVALASGLVALIAGHLITERPRWLAGGGAFVAGTSFAFASEPWENAGRADVHALNVFFVALVVWLVLTWGAAERAGARRAGRWLVAAALAFGLGLGSHPLVGLTAFGIAAWLVAIDARIWRRWRLVAMCAAALAIGLASYAFIFLRAVTDPAPPLFYAHPDTWERFRYLVFAEQFHGLFSDFAAPFSDLAAKWNDSERVLAAQFVLPGWIVVAAGAAVLATRRPGAFALVGLVVIATAVYAMNFRDGDIDRYYLPVIAMAAPLIGVAAAAAGGAAGRALRHVGRRLVGTAAAGRRLARAGAGLVLTLAVLMPAASLVTGYVGHDQSGNREADAWVASVYAQLPANAVVISWWSYSTPLWYHRWILGERPDVTIIDERNILDDGYRTMDNAIRTHLGERPVYVVPPHWDWDELADEWDFRTVSTYPGYVDLLFIEGPRQ